MFISEVLYLWHRQTWNAKRKSIDNNSCLKLKKNAKTVFEELMFFLSIFLDTFLILIIVSDVEQYLPTPLFLTRRSKFAEEKSAHHHLNENFFLYLFRIVWWMMSPCLIWRLILSAIKYEEKQSPFSFTQDFFSFNSNMGKKQHNWHSHFQTLWIL